jgi:hypothetical protein
MQFLMFQPRFMTKRGRAAPSLSIDRVRDASVRILPLRRQDHIRMALRTQRRDWAISDIVRYRTIYQYKHVTD